MKDEDETTKQHLNLVSFLGVQQADFQTFAVQNDPCTIADSFELFLVNDRSCFETNMDEGSI